MSRNFHTGLLSRPRKAHGQGSNARRGKREDWRQNSLARAEDTYQELDPRVSSDAGSPCKAKVALEKRLEETVEDVEKLPLETKAAVESTAQQNAPSMSGQQVFLNGVVSQGSGRGSAASSIVHRALKAGRRNPNVQRRANHRQRFTASPTEHTHTIGKVSAFSGARARHQNTTVCQRNSRLFHQCKKCPVHRWEEMCVH